VKAKFFEPNWPEALGQLDERGFVLIHGFLAVNVCERIAAGYDDDDQFRSRIEMSRHAFGRGEYKYFKYPLPKVVAQLREELYPRLVPLANEWRDRLRLELPRYPESLTAFTAHCRRAGQRRPTPLLLKYGPADFNCLHQDLYGGILFPFQATFFLSRPSDFAGGEFVLTEQQPRRQSRAEVLRPEQGDGVIFAVAYRPVRGSRGYYRAHLRHGVSTVRSGSRCTLGIIFHDAK
jgi:hypothetical protein